MTIKASVLKPGLLVSLKTSIRGGVAYQRRELEGEHLTSEGTQRARWETLREISDPQEFKLATEARSKARALVTAACSHSSFGMLCPTAQQDQLTAAIDEARKVSEAFNGTATSCRVDVYVLVGRVAQDDEEAARAIASEVRELIDAMRQGIKDADPETIRTAANKARELGAMLTPDVGAKVSEAIKEARTAAREIVKRVQKDGETVAAVIQEVSVAKLTAARFAFLDTDESTAPVETIHAPARAVDIEPAPAANTEGGAVVNAAADGEARSLELF